MASEKPRHTKEHSKAKKHKSSVGHKKVFDVVPPGKSPAAPNSRSVIVGHKPKVADDQFVKGNELEPSESGGGSRLAGDPSEKRPLLDSHKKIELRPAPAVGTSGKKGKSDADKPAKSEKSAPEKSAKKDTVEVKTSKDGSDGEADRAGTAGNASTVSASIVTTAPLVPKGSSGANVATVGRKAPAGSGPSATLHGAGQHEGLSASELLADLAVEHTVEPDDLDELQGIPAGPVPPVAALGAAHGTAVSPVVSPKDVHIDASGRLSQSVSMGSADPGPSAGLGLGGGSSDVSDPGAPAGRRSASFGAPDSDGAAAGYTQPKTVDDLLAESSAPELASQKAIVSTHRHRGQSRGIGAAVLIFLIVVVVAAIVLDLLLDAGILRTGVGLPYTDFL